MTVCINPLVGEVVGTLPADLREDFEERAAIMEHDGELPRAEAECRALLSVLRRYPEAVAGVTVLRFHMGGVPQYLLATDLGLAGRHLAHLGAVEVDTVPLAEVVADRCGGLAALMRLIP